MARSEAPGRPSAGYDDRAEEFMSLKDAIHRFVDGVSDLTNLEVTTYSGKLEQVIDGKTGQLRWEEFRPGNGQLVLVAATLVRPNHSTVNYRASELEPANLKALTELHAAAVETAQNGRMAMVKMFLGLLHSTGVA
jgi:hypothetical protein